MVADMKCPICGKELAYVSEHLITKHHYSKNSNLVKKYRHLEYEESKKYSNPPNWHFPISKREMHRRRMKQIDKALKKLGLTREELNKMHKPKPKGKKKSKSKR